jgi:hypothetical protein
VDFFDLRFLIAHPELMLSAPVSSFLRYSYLSTHSTARETAQEPGKGARCYEWSNGKDDKTAEGDDEERARFLCWCKFSSLFEQSRNLLTYYDFIVDRQVQVNSTSTSKVVEENTSDSN